MKTCNICLAEKPLEEFYTRSARCKPCHNEYTQNHYKENKQFKELVRQAKSRPCADCKETYPYYVMDFDHLGDKSFNISEYMTRVGWAKLKAEIDKCDVVCSNCHRIRTHLRLNS